MTEEQAMALEIAKNYDNEKGKTGLLAYADWLGDHNRDEHERHLRWWMKTRPVLEAVVNKTPSGRTVHDPHYERFPEFDEALQLCESHDQTTCRLASILVALRENGPLHLPYRAYLRAVRRVYEAAILKLLTGVDPPTTPLTAKAKAWHYKLCGRPSYLNHEEEETHWLDRYEDLMKAAENELNPDLFKGVTEYKGVVANRVTSIALATASVPDGVDPSEGEYEYYNVTPFNMFIRAVRAIRENQA